MLIASDSFDLCLVFMSDLYNRKVLYILFMDVSIYFNLLIQISGELLEICLSTTCIHCINFIAMIISFEVFPAKVVI